MSEEDYFKFPTKINKKKKNKQNDKHLVELYEIFQTINPQKVKDTYYKNAKNINKTMDELLSYQEPLTESSQQIEKMFSDLDKQRNDDFLDYNKQMEEVGFTIRSFIQSKDSNFTMMMDECRKGLQEMEDYGQLLNVNDVDNEFITKTQEFIFECIQQQKNNPFDPSQFPRLPDTGDNPYLQKRSKQQEQQLLGFHYDDKFLPKKPPPHSRFGAVQELYEEFPLLERNQIEYAYDNLHTYDDCKKFLLKNYDYAYQEKRVRQVKQQQQAVNKSINFQQSTKSLSELQREYDNLRKMIADIYMQKTVVNHCVGKYGKQFNHSLLSAHQEKERQKLIPLQDKAYVLLTEMMIKQNKFDRIDLHGYFGEELIDFLDNILEFIRVEGKQKQVEIITGKGLHSKNRKSVIGPIVKDYMIENNYTIISNDEGRIIIKL